VYYTIITNSFCVNNTQRLTAYVNEEGGDWSRNGEFEQSPEGESHLRKKSPPDPPFNGRKKPRESLTLSGYYWEDT
jgi:hypothetical protein